MSPTSTVTRWAVVASAPNSSSAATSTATPSTPVTPAPPAGRRAVPRPSSSTSTPTSSRSRSVSRASASVSWSSGWRRGATARRAARRRPRPTAGSRGRAAGARGPRRRRRGRPAPVVAASSSSDQLVGPPAPASQLVGRPRVRGRQPRADCVAQPVALGDDGGQGAGRLGGLPAARRRARHGAGPPRELEDEGAASAATATTETRATTTSADVSDRRSGRQRPGLRLREPRGSATASLPRPERRVRSASGRRPCG